MARLKACPSEGFGAICHALLLRKTCLAEVPINSIVGVNSGGVLHSGVRPGSG